MQLPTNNKGEPQQGYPVMYQQSQPFISKDQQQYQYPPQQMGYPQQYPNYQQYTPQYVGQQNQYGYTTGQPVMPQYYQQPQPQPHYYPPKPQPPKKQPSPYSFEPGSDKELDKALSSIDTMYDDMFDTVNAQQKRADESKEQSQYFGDYSVGIPLSYQGDNKYL